MLVRWNQSIVNKASDRKSKRLVFFSSFNKVVSKVSFCGKLLSFLYIFTVSLMSGTNHLIPLKMDCTLAIQALGGLISRNQTSPPLKLLLKNKTENNLCKEYIRANTQAVLPIIL